MHEWISRIYIIYINQQENQFHSKINIVMGYEQMGHSNTNETKERLMNLLKIKNQNK